VRKRDGDCHPLSLVPVEPTLNLVEALLLEVVVLGLGLDQERAERLEGRAPLLLGGVPLREEPQHLAGRHLAQVSPLERVGPGQR